MKYNTSYFLEKINFYQSYEWHYFSYMYVEYRDMPNTYTLLHFKNLHNDFLSSILRSMDVDGRVLNADFYPEIIHPLMLVSTFMHTFHLNVSIHLLVSSGSHDIAECFKVMKNRLGTSKTD